MSVSRLTHRARNQRAKAVAKILRPVAVRLGYYLNSPTAEPNQHRNPTPLRSLMKTVSFSAMVDGTQADYQLLQGLEAEHVAGLPARILKALEGLAHSLDGYKIDRLQHSLQTASRAEADGMDIEWIVAALIHDLGDDLAPMNHSQVAAAIIRPYVRPEVTWVVEMHGLFQRVYFAHHLGEDPNGRDLYRDHPFYDACMRFCAAWDQAAFDPDYETPPLAHFAPMVREIFSRKPFDPSIVNPNSSDPAQDPALRQPYR